MTSRGPSSLPTTYRFTSASGSLLSSSSPFLFPSACLLRLGLRQVHHFLTDRQDVQEGYAQGSEVHQGQSKDLAMDARATSEEATLTLFAFHPDSSRFVRTRWDTKYVDRAFWEGGRGTLIWILPFSRNTNGSEPPDASCPSSVLSLLYIAHASHSLTTEPAYFSPHSSTTSASILSHSGRNLPYASNFARSGSATSFIPSCARDWATKSSKEIGTVVGGEVWRECAHCNGDERKQEGKVSGREGKRSSGLSGEVKRTAARYDAPIAQPCAEPEEV